MSEHFWSLPGEPEHPVAVARSEPVPIRFEARTDPDLRESLALVTFYGDRRIAMTPATPQRIGAIASSPAWQEPVELVAVGSYEDDSGALVLNLFAAVTVRYDWLESEETELFLGTRFRGAAHQRFAGDLERETRDFLLSLLQGSPRRAIEALCEEATKESVAMHEAWERCRRQAIEDGLPPSAYRPGRDIAEGLWPRRWKSTDLDG